MTYSVEFESGIRPLVQLRRNRLTYIAQIGQRSVDIRCLKIGSRRIFQVNHPDLIRDVLVTHDWNFIKGQGLRASRPVLGKGLLTSEGELHRRQRRLVQPAFHNARLESYGDIMVACADAASRSWTDASSIAIDREMMRLTLEIVGRTLFGADLGDDAAGVGASLTRALRLFLMLNSPVIQLLAPLRWIAERKAARSRNEIEQVLHKVIDEHRRDPNRYDDMLSMLLRSSDEGGTGYMSEDLLLDESLTLFLAGHETTANALTWTWYLLAQHPEAAERLHAELDEVLDGQLPNPSDLSRLRFTGQIFREALRLYPPAWIVAREAVTDYRLGQTEVPAGSTLVMSPYATHRDPRFWKSPESFEPDRWTDEACAGRPKFAFFPFGAGTRVCIGEHFAMMEGVLLLATIAQQWSLHLVPRQKVQMWPQLTLRPRHSIQMRLEARDKEMPGAVSAASMHPRPFCPQD
jgi:cytochrome P450